ncbi:MAG: hypothetical protein ACK5KL_02360 [Dysgonomonas sp.]
MNCSFVCFSFVVRFSGLNSLARPDAVFSGSLLKSSDSSEIAH